MRPVKVFTATDAFGVGEDVVRVCLIGEAVSERAPGGSGAGSWIVGVRPRGVGSYGCSERSLSGCQGHGHTSPREKAR